MIASDMDGTLLNNKMEVSDENAKAIKAAQAKGIEFIVATGRSITEAKPLISAHDLKTAFITTNGALVFDSNGKRAIEIPIPMPKVKQLVDLLSSENLYFELMTTEGTYSESRVKRIQNVADLLVSLNPDQPYKIAVALAAARLELMNIHYVNSFYDLIKQPNVKVFKIIAFDKQGQKAFTKAKKALKDLGNLVVTSSSDNNIEINDINAQKGIALARYAKFKNIPMNEVMAIGDNLNDASMIRAAGIGVAMANAVPQIRDIAQRQTDYNTRNGVAKAIQWAIDGEV